MHNDISPQTSFHYCLTDLKARKIAVLIKFARLEYLLEETADPESVPHVLRTPQGELQS